MVRNSLGWAGAVNRRRDRRADVRTRRTLSLAEERLWQDEESSIEDFGTMDKKLMSMKVQVLDFMCANLLPSLTPGGEDGRGI